MHRALTVFARAARLRCPHCGGRPVFLSWARMSPNCPVCGLRFERGERGYWLGAYFVNLMWVEVVFAVWFLGFLLIAWPDPRWDLLELQLLVLMFVVPIVSFPYSKTFFLAFDLLVRPAGPDDFRAPQEAARIHRPGNGPSH